MAFVKILLLALLLIIIAGFGYFAITDVPVHQSETVETIYASDLKK